MVSSSPEAILLSYAPLVEARLESLLPQPNQQPVKLHEAMRYAVLSPGKRLRPALCMASAVAVGGAALDAVDAAAALEILHCFSLVHDDLPAIDNDDLRRGRPTCHKQFGEAVALLAGDGLFNLAFEIMASTNAGLEGVRELAQAAGALVRGETLDVLSEGTPATESVLEQIHREKTGALFAASCAIGGLCGGGSSTDVQHLRQYGIALGLAFQIADDVLNDTSTAEQLGKAAGSDRHRQKVTYPALFGLDGAKHRARQASQAAQEALNGLTGDTSALTTLAEYAIQRSR